MSKRVRVTIEMDTHFISLLNANVGLTPGGLRGDNLKRQAPDEVLKRVVLMEARGASEEQVHVVIPPEWRPHIEVVHDERRVSEDGSFSNQSDT